MYKIKREFSTKYKTVEECLRNVIKIKKKRNN
jgi:hypothetical protein